MRRAASGCSHPHLCAGSACRRSAHANLVQSMCPHVPHLLCPPLCCCSEDPEQRRFNEWELRELEDREDWEEDVPAVSCWFVLRLAMTPVCMRPAPAGQWLGSGRRRHRCC